MGPGPKEDIRSSAWYRGCLRDAIAQNMKEPSEEHAARCSELRTQYCEAVEKERERWDFDEKVSAKLRAMVAPDVSLAIAEPKARFDLWFWVRVAFVVLCAAVVLVLVSACASPSRPDVRAASAQELRSVVALVRPEQQWREPSLSSTDFGNSTGHSVLTYAPYCNAFAVQSGPGRVVLVTAAHCLKRAGLSFGDVARYREPSGWGLGGAVVALVDAQRDYAELALRDGSALVPLSIGSAPLDGAQLSTPSAYFGESTSGRVQVPAVSIRGRFEFTATIKHGWSGSPVIDARGRAVGVVTECIENKSGRCVEGVIAVAL